MKRKSRSKQLESAAKQIAEAQRLIYFGNDFTTGKMAARKALDMLFHSSALDQDDNSGLELGGEACRLMAAGLRTSGHLEAASGWADSAVALLRNTTSYTCLSEVYNIKSLIEINNAQRSIPDKHGILSRRLIDTTQNFEDFVNDHLHVAGFNPDRRIEVLTRQADILEIAAGPGIVVEFIEKSGYESIARERPEHSRCLRLIYLGKILSEDGKLDQAWIFLEEASGLPVASHSNFIKIMLFEAMAKFFEKCNEPEIVEDYQRRANVLRKLESIR